MAKRLTEAQRAREERRQAAEGEALEEWPDAEVSAHYYGVELIVLVDRDWTDTDGWPDGTYIRQFRDLVDDIEAAYTGREALTR